MGSQTEGVGGEREAGSSCLLVVPVIVTYPHFLGPRAGFFPVAAAYPLAVPPLPPVLEKQPCHTPSGTPARASCAPSSELRASHVGFTPQHRLFNNSIHFPLSLSPRVSRQLL